MITQVDAIDPRFATQCENVFEFAALIVYHAVRVFLEHIEDEDLQIFRIFEEYISILVGLRPPRLELY